MVTLKTIAEECGLSSAAVSKALHHLPGVSESNAEMVRDKARELGYYPNAAARTLKTRQSRNVGVLFESGVSNEFFSAILDEIRDRLEDEDYDVTLLSNRHKRGSGYYGHVMRLQCDGVIVVHHIFDPEGMERLLASPTPVVSIDSIHPGHTSVLSENLEGMRDSVHYLAGMGHTHIAFVHGEMGDVTSQRIQGFRQGCAECGIEVPDDYVVAARFQDPAASREATGRLLSLGVPPTCIMFPDDYSYLGGIAELSNRSLTVPDDMSCFGYDGMRLAADLDPALTTYRQDAAGMGRIAVEALLREMGGDGTQDKEVIRVAGRVQLGGTVARID
ncbi:MAG: LacI family transcriptional regulator [Atopobiaceae bacterium]|nr:LacI family transcriptional regulator [Atopobiaceae bacterium]MCI2172830.1 LacI family transcriptional regulator [Atopobiaceae bacterium]MCI2207137.1 LacI family transcriptional regulator [Atopobiaceae bacterium]